MYVCYHKMKTYRNCCKHRWTDPAHLLFCTLWHHMTPRRVKFFLLEHARILPLFIVLSFICKKWEVSVLHMHENDQWLLCSAASTLSGHHAVIYYSHLPPPAYTLLFREKKRGVEKTNRETMFCRGGQPGRSKMISGKMTKWEDKVTFHLPVIVHDLL